MSQMTTTRNGFKVEDVTFRNARRQSEIENEIERNEDEDNSRVQPPVSLTPEQVKSFYISKIATSKDSNEKRVYAQTIKWINEMLAVKKKLLSIEAKEVGEVKDETGIDEV